MPLLHKVVIAFQSPKCIETTPPTSKYKTSGENNYDMLWENYDKVQIPRRLPPPTPPEVPRNNSVVSTDSGLYEESLYKEIEYKYDVKRFPPPPTIPPPKPPQITKYPQFMKVKRVAKQNPKITLGLGILLASVCVSTIIALGVTFPKSGSTTTTTTTTTIATPQPTTETSAGTTSSTTTSDNMMEPSTTPTTMTSTVETIISTTPSEVIPDPGMYLMVLHGSVKGGLSYSEVELLSLEEKDPLPSCLENLNNAQFVAEEGAGAALSDGTPLVCARDGHCYKYHSNSDTWQQMLDNIINERYGSGYAYNDEMGLVMAGGYVDVCQGNLCTEFEFDSVDKNDGFSIEAMTPLPHENAHNCLVSGRNATLYSTGGSNKNLDASVMVLSSSTNDWIKAAEMSEGRYRHSCGLVSGPNDTNILVVGGGEGIFISLTTEVYSVEEDSWRQGTPFPHAITSAASVQYDGSLLVVGGYTGGINGSSDEIYKYNPLTESWDKLNVTLRKPDYKLVAFMVPKAIFPPCNDMVI